MTGDSLQYGRHDISDADVAPVAAALLSDWLTTGPRVNEFEAALAESLGGIPSVAVSSGTAALHAAYAGLGVSENTTIITTPLTFVATQATALQLGASIVFVDIEQDTGNIDPIAVSAYLETHPPENQTIISAVDYAGQPADYSSLRTLADQYGLLVLQDAAHSLGSLYQGMPVGYHADVATLSFFPTKNITTGEGGAVVSRLPEILDHARSFARQGLVRDPSKFQLPDEGPWHQEVHEFGLNYRMPDILAALGTSQLARLPLFKARRAVIKARYDSAFSEIAELTIPHQRSDVDPMWHLYPLRVPAHQRRTVFEGLREQGIWVQVNYLPAYWHPAFDSEKYPRGLCPIAENYYREEISLPMHTQLTDSDVDRVIDAVLHLVN